MGKRRAKPAGAFPSAGRPFEVTEQELRAGALNGIIAGNPNAAYEPGLRSSAVGGFRHAEEPLSGRPVVGSLRPGGRFRRGTRLIRWRPDKAPEQCPRSQVEHESRASVLFLQNF